MDFTMKEVRNNIWTIDQNGVRSYLLIGSDTAILVDTCFGGELKAAVTSITDKPIILITTHADPDHIGGDEQFPVHYLHKDEFLLYEKRTKKPVTATPVNEGFIFNVGTFTLEVIHIPGHTPGSIALLDRKHHFLISGDTVQHNCIFMHGEDRDLTAFRSSIEKLHHIYLEGVFDTVFPSHGPAIVPADILQDHLALADNILNRSAVPIGPAPDWFPDSVKTYQHNRAQMFY